MLNPGWVCVILTQINLPAPARVGVSGLHDREAGADLRVPERAHHLPRVPRQVGSAPQVPVVQGKDARPAAEKHCHREDDRQASCVQFLGSLWDEEMIAI